MTVIQFDIINFQFSLPSRTYYFNFTLHPFFLQQLLLFAVCCRASIKCENAFHAFYKHFSAQMKYMKQRNEWVIYCVCIPVSLNCAISIYTYIHNNNKSSIQQEKKKSLKVEWREVENNKKKWNWTKKICYVEWI